MLAWLGGAKKRLRASRGSASRSGNKQPHGLITSPDISKQQNRCRTAPCVSRDNAAASGKATAELQGALRSHCTQADGDLTKLRAVHCICLPNFARFAAA